MAMEYKPRNEDSTFGDPVKLGNGETLAETTARLEQENKLLKLQNKANAERMEFMEDLIAEIAMKVYE